MLDKLAQIETRYEELTNELSSPELLANPAAYGKAAKQLRGLGARAHWRPVEASVECGRQILAHELPSSLSDRG